MLWIFVHYSTHEKVNHCIFTSVCGVAVATNTKASSLPIESLATLCGTGNLHLSWGNTDWFLIVMVGSLRQATICVTCEWIPAVIAKPV